ncbi:PKD domain-containing protein, partial [bacterium]
AYIPVATGSSAQDGWRQAGLPLKAIRGFERTNKTIKEITVASDSTSSFYIGDLRVVSDPTPIRAEPNIRSINLALNDIATLSAKGEGGSSVLRYTWDFDDKDGITVDAEGSTVTHKFRRPGDFTVTVTVQDEYGLKDPYTTTIQVKVNP